ncbi:MAG: ligase-associated DNA damage response DEXH box helicase [Pseudomonadota bacterium]
MTGISRDDIDCWFASNDWQVFDFQASVWDACQAGQSGLLHSPTGSGKTLAALLGPLMRFGHEPDPALRVLWITPLRALANDTGKSLRQAIDALGSPWQVGLRTGDTSSSERTRQKKQPPQVLITTPESLSLLLSYADGAKTFRHLEAVIVDEWHELLGNKRGVQLELCLARLRHLRPSLVTWGLSATLANLEQAAQVLCPPPLEPALIRGDAPKAVDVLSVMPDTLEQFPWSGRLGIGLLDAVIDHIEQARSTLVFTNTRSQSELWFEALLGARPDWIGRIALHHGSIDRKLRQRIEQALREGDLLAVVCTSSLDLGVDFAPVDQVMQIGSPKGVARLMQRAGRSGHQPDAVSRILCVPTYALELIEIAAARSAWQARRIEARVPLRLCLDVLSQHLVTIALGTGFTADEMRDEVRQTYAFADLDEMQWGWCIDFITRGGQALAGYPQFQRVVETDGVYRMTDRRLSRQHRMSVGTITSDTAMRVKWMTGGTLGTIEESFVSRLKTGDRFLFAGRLVALVQIRDMTAYVKRAKPGKKTVPRWQGGRMPLSNELSHSMLALLQSFQRGEPTTDELGLLAPLLKYQQQVSCLPSESLLLIERCKSREGHSVFVFPFAGRLAHEGLATLIAYRISREIKITFTLSVNDYGFELLSRDALEFDEAAFRRWSSPDSLLDDLFAAINVGEAAKRQFRDIARIAGLIFSGYPGSGKSTRQIQASSGLIFDVLARYDEDNLLLDQSRREVLDAQMETRRMQDAMSRIATLPIHIRTTERLSPFAFPLWAERLQSQIMSSETWRERVAKMAESLNRRAATS